MFKHRIITIRGVLGVDGMYMSARIKAPLKTHSRFSWSGKYFGQHDYNLMGSNRYNGKYVT